MSANLNQPTRILRNYRFFSPAKFHALNEKVVKGLSDNPNIPASIWSSTPTLLPSYFAASEKHNTVYHQAMYGSKLDIAERDLLQAQIIEYLDEIASILEAAAFRNPKMLLSSGFELGKERRSRARTKSGTTVEDVQAPDAEQSSSG